MRKVWIDDVRLPPEEYDVWCSNSKYAISFIEKFWGQIEKISFDHDLGEDYKSGYDIIKFMEAKVYVDSWDASHIELDVHSDNPVGRKNIETAIQSIKNSYLPYKN